MAAWICFCQTQAAKADLQVETLTALALPASAQRAAPPEQEYIFALAALVTGVGGLITPGPDRRERVEVDRG